jgi:hypothetical protein
MPATKGLLNYLSKLEEIDISDLRQGSSLKEDETILENRLGNIIIYPQVLPQTEKDLLFNYILIRKIICLNLGVLYNNNLKRIDIPEEFLEFVPNLQNLVGAFIDVIKTSGVTTLCLKSNKIGRLDLGTLIRPEELQTGSFITIGVKDQQYQIETGSMVIIPIPESRADITFTSTTAKLMGKKVMVMQIVAGKLGLIVDARI